VDEHVGLVRTRRAAPHALGIAEVEHDRGACRGFTEWTSARCRSTKAAPTPVIVAAARFSDLEHVGAEIAMIWLATGPPGSGDLRRLNRTAAATLK